jgi:hypothetical protein
LSRSSGQVPHVLLTRSPLSTRASPGFSFDLHVLGAPPAFVLSQDQTLHRDFNPTNNSAEYEIGESPVRVTSAPFRQLARRPPRGSRRAEFQGDVSRDTPALAFGVTVPFSRSRCPTPEERTIMGNAGANHSASAEPTLTSRLWWAHKTVGPTRSVRVNPPAEVTGADWRYYGPGVDPASRTEDFSARPFR